MRMRVCRPLKQAWAALLLFALAAATQAVARQGPTHAQGSRAQVASAKLEVEGKARYFLGETPAVRIVLTNNGRSPQTLKEAEYQKFSLELTGLFENASQPEQKAAVYDGSFDIPKEPPVPTPPGQTHEWLELKKREPKLVTLAPGESTTLELNLSKTFRSLLGVSKYRLVVKSEDGQQAARDFEVYFDDEKSVTILAKMLASPSDEAGERNWAVYNLSRFSRPKLVTLLEELVRSGDEKQRDFAGSLLRQLAAGRFDPVRLKVEIKERYFVGEAPVLAVSIQNASSTTLTLKEAQYQKFSLELSGEPGAGQKQEAKTCVYDGGQDATKPPAGRDRREPQLVKLSELESTTLSLNLFDCFRSRLDVGKYELTVRAADEPAVTGQKVTKSFEVYFDEGKSVPALAQVLKSEDAAGQRWAVSALAQYSRPKLITLLEEIVKTGSEKQREFAARILKEIKAGRLG